jgi:hypothetical protein
MYTLSEKQINEQLMKNLLHEIKIRKKIEEKEKKEVAKFKSDFFKQGIDAIEMKEFKKEYKK